MPYPPRAQRLLAILAVASIAGGGALALTDVAAADESFSRDGWCRPGEGQTVVIDWRATGDALPDVEQPQIIRCIFLAPEARTYPVEGRLPPLTDPLESAGILYDFNAKGVVTSINGVPTNSADGFSWNWSTGTVAQGDTEALWLGKSAWEPEAGVDTFVGITLTDTPSVTGNALPASPPMFDSSPPTPKPSVSSSTSASVSASASATLTTPSTPATSPSTATSTPIATSSSIATSSPIATSAAPISTPATQPAPVTSAAPSTTAAPTTAAAPTAPAPTTTAQRPSRTQRPPRATQPPRRTSRPQPPTDRPLPPMNPPAPPVQELPPPPPPPTPEELPSDPPVVAAGPATDVPAAAPSKVWGREDTTRQGMEATSQRAPAPWSRLVALAGAVVIVGGLGTAFARGLATSAPPVVEEE